MFTKAEIERAHRIAKVASAFSPAVSQVLGHAAPVESAAPKILDPYVYNGMGSAMPSLKQMGYNPPGQPSFLGSLGKSVGGLAMTPFDVPRSLVGFGPQRSGFRNWIGGAPRALGGRVFNYLSGGGHNSHMFDKWITEGNADTNRMRNGGWWQAPAQRAYQQSAEYRGAFPKYLEQHAPFFVHPWKTIAQWGSEAASSPFPSP